ncbi:hypothetical protein [Nocardia cyriacigeorgica]|nr:hypothetical protein [Nocardia cyriacigeorgica]
MVTSRSDGDIFARDQKYVKYVEYSRRPLVSAVIIIDQAKL